MFKSKRDNKVCIEMAAYVIDTKISYYVYATQGLEYGIGRSEGFATNLACMCCRTPSSSDSSHRFSLLPHQLFMKKNGV